MKSTFFSPTILQYNLLHSQNVGIVNHHPLKHLVHTLMIIKKFIHHQASVEMKNPITFAISSSDARLRIVRFPLDSALSLSSNSLFTTRTYRYSIYPYSTRTIFEDCYYKGDFSKIIQSLFLLCSFRFNRPSIDQFVHIRKACSNGPRLNFFTYKTLPMHCTQ